MNLVYVLIISCIFAINGAKIVSECEKKAHTSFNPINRAELCEDAPTDQPIGPAVCSVSAKDTLRMKVADIIELCRGAPSAAPAECMARLDGSMRSKIGLSLCAGASSTLPAECYSLLHTKHTVDESIATFCAQIDDHAALDCAVAALQHTAIPLPKAMLICADVVENTHSVAVPRCIEHLKGQIQGSLGVTAEKVVKFCSEINPTVYQAEDTDLLAAADCYLQSNVLGSQRTRSGGTLTLTAIQRLSLCSNAPIADGPINCSLAILDNKDPMTKLRAEDVISLCRASHGTGPADCYSESRGLGSTEARIGLCNSARSAGPAHCYRRASGVFRQDEQSRMLLCVGAVSEGPAHCAASAPHYLTTNEKIHVCSSAGTGNYNDPIKCLQVVQSLSPRFYAAPKKALGYFIENLLSDTEKTSRAILLQLCSFGDSQDPLAAAECFKSVPTTIAHGKPCPVPVSAVVERVVDERCFGGKGCTELNKRRNCSHLVPVLRSSLSLPPSSLHVRSHLLADEAALMCRNISSTEVIEHLLLCYRILPKAWTDRPVDTEVSSASILCEGLRDRRQVEAVVKCAVETSKNTKIHSSWDNIAAICNTESNNGDVLHCLKQSAHPQVLSAISLGHVTITNSTIPSLCKSATSRSVGDCLLAISLHATSNHYVLDGDVPALICRSTKMTYQSILNCIQVNKKPLITAKDVEMCQNVNKSISTVRLYGIQTEDGGEKVVANKRFTVLFQLHDQFNQLYLDDKQLLFGVSINANNKQGAVLLGIRSNHTNTQGILQFQNLMITQAGAVDMTISIKSTGKVISILRLNVQENPLYKDSSHCLYVFTKSICSSDESEESANLLFPVVRSMFSYQSYLTHLSCVDKISIWQVKAFLHADGQMFVEYRTGIDSIWTGVNMINPDMTMLERLGLSEADIAEYAKSYKSKHKTHNVADYNKGLLKLIKRAYYKASLQWHPDRWAGFDQYAFAVQAAFQLVTEAYEHLQVEFGVPAAMPTVEQPVYT